MPRTNAVLQEDLTLAVLAGGRGARFGGVDKGFISVAGRPLIEHVLARVRPQAERIVINANRSLDAYARYGHPLVRDEALDFAGPLGGIASVLSTVRTEWVLFAPVDAALLPLDYAQEMCAAAPQNGTRACVVHDGEGAVPVCCLVAVVLREDLRTFMQRGERSVKAWLRRHNAAPVSFAHWPREFWSLNTPQELMAVKRRLINHQGSIHGFASR